MKIRAFGKKEGTWVDVEYDGFQFLFNGKINSKYENDITYEISAGYSSGMYYPDRESNLNLINVIENHFFDRNVKAEIFEAEIEEMENVEGRIY